MKLLLALIPLAISLLATASEGKTDYHGYHVVSSTAGDREGLSKLKEILADRSLEHQLWSDLSIRRPVDIMVPRHQVEPLLERLRDVDLDGQILVEDVEELLDAEKKQAEEDCRSPNNDFGDMTFNDYHDVSVFYAYFDYLEDKYDFVSTGSIGLSYEGTDTKVLQICKGGCGSKIGMFIDAGIHAREWIAPATAMYLVQELVENDALHPELTERVNWYIVPSANPDGYAYSRTEDRFWRMTRRPNVGGCIGADPNRNWDFAWGQEGASDDPCDPGQSYRGDFAFSEVESLNIANAVLETENLVFYNSLHSFGEYVLLPYGYTEERPPNYDDLLVLGNLGADALAAVDGHVFAVGSIPDLLYLASGSSIDWVLAEKGLKYAYGMELRGRLFLLPPSLICVSGEEVFRFHEAIANALYEEFSQP